VRRPDGSWLVPARWRIDEVVQATGVVLPEGEGYDTVSGLVLQLLGRVPQPGDAVDVAVPRPVLDPDTDPDTGPRGARLEVLTVHRHVPATVRMCVLDPLDSLDDEQVTA